MNGNEIMAKIVETIIDPLILLLFSAGIFIFMWGLIVFLTQLDNPEGRKKGVQHMIWGIAGVFIMATVLGIINIITSTFGLDNPTNLLR